MWARLWPHLLLWEYPVSRDLGTYEKAQKQHRRGVRGGWGRNPEVKELKTFVKLQKKFFKKLFNSFQPHTHSLGFLPKLLHI